jgi:hypothetical protein
MQQDIAARKKRSWDFIQKLFELLVQCVNLIEKTKDVVVKDKSINIYHEFKEARQTLDKLKTKLAPFYREDCPITEPSLLNSINLRLEIIKKHLSELEPEVSFVFFVAIKIKVYAADFVIYLELEHISSMFDPKLKSPLDIFTDNEAKTVWSMVFGDEVAFVPWREFFSKMLQFMKEEWDFDRVYNSTETRIIELFTDFTQDGVMSPWKWSIFLKWFGPTNKCFDRLLEAVRTGLLSGPMSAHEAAHVLSEKPPGYFTIRFSKTQPGSFAVTFKDSKQEIRHSLLHPVEPNGITLKDPPQVFKNLKEFVNFHSRKLRTPIGNAYMSQLGATSSSRNLLGFYAESNDESPIPSSEEKVTPSSVESKSPQMTPPSTSGNTPPASSTSSPSSSWTPSNTNTSTSGPPPKLLDKDLCVVCLDAPRNTVFLECGHVACCKKCSKKLVDCPICRQRITRVIEIFTP